jgi:hypothetical protein
VKASWSTTTTYRSLTSLFSCLGFLNLLKELCFYVILWDLGNPIDKASWSTTTTYRSLNFFSWLCSTDLFLE